MLTGCFLEDPVRGFDSRVDENIFQDVFEHGGRRG